jgi:hypothetical protein
MELVFYATIFFVGVSMAATFVQNLVYPPVELELAELPEVIRHELQSKFPGFHPTQIYFLGSRHRYTLIGQLAERSARIEFDLTPDHELAEVEFREYSGPTGLVGKTRIPPTAIPAHLADVISGLITGDFSHPAGCRAYAGRIGDEDAFNINIRSHDWKYDLEITHSGRIVEFEKMSLES